MTTSTCYVISDLHLADGGPLEEFADDEVFARWMSSHDAPSTTVVLNGDVLAFDAIPPLDPAPGTPSHLLWTQEVSVAKMRACLDAHVAFFDTLASFHARGGSIRIHVGNHDLDFVWADVQALVRARLDADGSERLVFETVGSRFGNVWIEHGHRFDRTNRTDDAYDFVHVGPGGLPYLERTWGIDFVLEFINPLYEELPFLNNVKPQWKLVLEGLKRNWLGWRDFVRAVAFISRRGVPVSAIADVVLSDEVQRADLSWLDSYFTDEETALLVRAAISELGSDQANELGYDGLAPEFVAALAEPVPIDFDPDEFGGVWATDPDGGADPTLGLFRDRGEVRGARSMLGDGIDHVVLGHTHHSVDGEDLGGGALLFNPGTWIEHLDLDDDIVRQRVSDDGLDRDVLSDEALYRTELFAVRIVDDGTPPALVSLEGFRNEAS